MCEISFIIIYLLIKSMHFLVSNYAIFLIIKINLFYIFIISLSHEIIFIKIVPHFTKDMCVCEDKMVENQMKQKNKLIKVFFL